MTITVHHGDSRNKLRDIPDASIDSIVTDPPYALVSIGKRFGADDAAPAKVGKTGAYQRASAGFMGKKWDTGETAFDPAFWADVMRVLKPGGHLIAASGTRTYHRLACAVEDAGFEIRDMVSWLYGSGFPKSHDVSKGIDKTLGKERTKIRMSAPKNPPNLVGGVNNGIDRPWRTEAAEKGYHEAVSDEAVSWQGWGTALKPACEPWVLARKPLVGTVAANVLKHGTGALNISASRVGSDGGCAGAGARVFGDGLNGKRGEPVEGLGRWPANVIHDGSEEVLTAFPVTPGQQCSSGPSNGSKGAINVYGDYGPRTQCNPSGDEGAARFFYSAKADALDRLGSKHPTVKPVDLMRWLCTLVTPPGGTVLDPFAGSGSTGIACLGAGFDCILIEREAEYVADIHRRIAWARGDGRLTAQESHRANVVPLGHGSLFDRAAE